MQYYSIPSTKKKSHLQLIIGSLFVIILPLGIWASYADIDQVSHATGVVITSSKTQAIQAAIDGVIKDIPVKEGQNVAAGDLLVQLDHTQVGAGYEESKSKVAALQAALVRLNAEVYAKPLIFPESLYAYPEFISNQRELFIRRQQAINNEVAALRESLALSTEELNLNLPLLKSGDIGSSEIIRLKRQIADLKGQISNKRNKYFQDSQAEMTKVEEELATKEQELADRKVTFERSRINAPINSVVNNILISTQGARVRAGDLIMELVPFGDELIVESKISPSDLSFVRRGQLAAVKLDAYDYTIYGVFPGRVQYISPDALIEKTPEGERRYFRVQVILDKNKINVKDGKKIEIAPGMTAQVDIVTGNRTVLEYLFKPLTKTFSESFHER